MVEFGIGQTKSSINSTKSWETKERYDIGIKIYISGLKVSSYLVILVEYITYYFSFTGLDKTELSFSSQAQYLAVNEASVSWLIDKVSDDLDFKRDTAVHRFRGNIIVGGCKAFDEMQWEYVHIGNNNFKV